MKHTITLDSEDFLHLLTAIISPDAYSASERALIINAVQNEDFTTKLPW